MFSKLFAATAFVAVLATAVSAADTCSRTTKVIGGESCNDVCQRTKTSLYQLHHFNSGIDAACSNLQPNQELCLAKTGKDCTGDNAYTVVKDDSCWLITHNHGISYDTFFANNGMTMDDCNPLPIGKVVCVASDLIPY